MLAYHILAPSFLPPSQENSTTCPATTSAPPSGVSVAGSITTGVVFGLLILVAVAIVVAVLAVVVMYRLRGRKTRYL